MFGSKYRRRNYTLARAVSRCVGRRATAHLTRERTGHLLLHNHPALGNGGQAPSVVSRSIHSTGTKRSSGRTLSSLFLQTIPQPTPKQYRAKEYCIPRSDPPTEEHPFVRPAPAAKEHQGPPRMAFACTGPSNGHHIHSHRCPATSTFSHHTDGGRLPTVESRGVP